MINATFSSVLADVNESDLGLDPNFNAPWMPVLRDVAGWAVGSLFVISGIILAVGVVMFLVAKAASNSNRQDSGVKAMVTGLIGVVVLGSIGALLVWAAGFDPFTESAAASAALVTLRGTVLQETTAALGGPADV